MGVSSEGGQHVIPSEPFAHTAGPKDARIMFIGEAWNWYDTRLPKRIWDKIIPEPNTWCWIWTGWYNKWDNDDGYGQVWWEKRVTSPHRVLYRTFVGEIPDGLELDHKCRVRSCCNPDHLEPVTRSENNKRGTVGDNQKRYWENALTCPYGHPRTPENLLIQGGVKYCGPCRRARTRWYRAGKFGKVEDYDY